MSSLFLQEGQAPTVKVRPLVVFSILDAFRRRDPDCELVLGTLLGQRVNNIIEVRDAFAVPFHKGVQKQFIGEEYAQEMLALKQSVSNDEVVGSFATTVSGQGKLNLTMSQISTFYQATYNNSDLIHLVVDTEMTDLRIGVTGYVQKHLKLQDRLLASSFQQVKVAIANRSEVKSTVDFMMKNLKLNATDLTESNANLVRNDMKNLENSIQRLLELLETVSDYAEKARVNPDARDGSLGYLIESALSSVPRINPAAFHKMFNDSLQDMLMITYLSNLMRAQVAVADKLAICDRMLEES